MTVQQQIAIAEKIIQTSLVSKVFHSCQLLRDDERRVMYPVYQVGAEFTYAGIDDSKGLFAYIRINGDLQAVPMRTRSCSGSYQVTAPLRVVFFNDNEPRDHDDLARRLMTFTFLQNVILTRVIQDRARLAAEESPMFREKFDGKTFYLAVDIQATFILLPSDCASEACISYPNPVTTCPAAVPQSTESATS
jgi:hypothetical protein